MESLFFDATLKIEGFLIDYFEFFSTNTVRKWMLGSRNFEVYDSVISIFEVIKNFKMSCGEDVGPINWEEVVLFCENEKN